MHFIVATKFMHTNNELTFHVLPYTVSVFHLSASTLRMNAYYVCTTTGIKSVWI